MDPRQFYLQWAAAGNPLAANPYLAGGMRPPGPLPAPYLHSLAQFHNLKALATKTFLEQQNLAKSILQQSQPSHTASASHCECLLNINDQFTPLLLYSYLLLFLYISILHTYLKICIFLLLLKDFQVAVQSSCKDVVVNL